MKLNHTSASQEKLIAEADDFAARNEVFDPCVRNLFTIIEDLDGQLSEMQRKLEEKEEA